MELEVSLAIAVVFRFRENLFQLSIKGSRFLEWRDLMANERIDSGRFVSEIVLRIVLVESFELSNARSSRELVRAFSRAREFATVFRASAKNGRRRLFESN